MQRAQGLARHPFRRGSGLLVDVSLSAGERLGSRFCRVPAVGRGGSVTTDTGTHVFAVSFSSVPCTKSDLASLQREGLSSRVRERRGFHVEKDVATVRGNASSPPVLPLTH